MKIAIEQKVFWGACVSLIGMGFITYNEIQNYNLHPTSILGFLISLIATVAASVGNLVSLKNRANKIPIAANNAWGMLYGSAFTFIYCILFSKSFVIQNVDTSFMISFIYLTLFGTIISFGSYLKLIEIFGPSRAAFTSVVSPVIAVMVSVYFENLPLTTYLLLGVIFCLAGNVVALAPKNILKLKSNAN